MDWFKGKSTGNHRYAAIKYGAFRLKFSLQPSSTNPLNTP